MTNEQIKAREIICISDRHAAWARLERKEKATWSGQLQGVIEWEAVDKTNPAHRD